MSPPERRGSGADQQRIAQAVNAIGPLRQQLEFRKSPAPGHIRTPDGSTAEFLSADKSSGHSSGFDIVIVDELGLMGERDLVAGMRTATSARNGRFIALSIRGQSPLLEEMLERRELSTCTASRCTRGGRRVGSACRALCS